MISFSKISGNIEIMNNSDRSSYTIILTDFEGTISVDNEVIYLKFILFGKSKINNDIELVNSEKLDIIQITGKGSCKFQSLHATSVEVYSDISINSISGNVIRLENVTVSSNEYNDYLFSSLGHIWFIDSVIICTNRDTVITTPFLLIDNSFCKIYAHIKAVDTSNAISVQHCKNVIITETELLTEHAVEYSIELNETKPKDFIYYIERDEKGKYIRSISREKLLGYTPAKQVTPVLQPVYDKDDQAISYVLLQQIFNLDYDDESELEGGISISNLEDIFDDEYIDNHHRHSHKIYESVLVEIFNGEYYIYTDEMARQAFDYFKDYTQYTNVDLHRRIDQEGEILPSQSEECIYRPILNAIFSGYWQGGIENSDNRISEQILDEIIDDEYVYDEHTHDDAILNENLVDIFNDEYRPLKSSPYIIPENKSRNYEVGIYSLNSYRTTSRNYYDDTSNTLELP